MEEEDLLAMKSLKDESWFGTHRITIKNMEQQKQWFKKIDNDKTFFFIVENNKGEKIGTYKISQVDWISRTCHSGYDVFLEKRGMKYAKPVLECGVDFAFEVLNMRRIETEVLENNKASLKTVLWVGFIKEGVKRKSIYKSGELLDSLVLGVLRKEWRNSDRVIKYNGLCNISYTPKNN